MSCNFQRKITGNDVIDRNFQQIQVILDSTCRQLDDLEGSVSTVEEVVDMAQPNAAQIFNVLVPFANVELSQALPLGTKSFMVRVRSGSSVLKFAFAAGQSGSTYIQVSRGASYESPILDGSSRTLYFQATSPGVVAEILVWKRV